MGWGGHGEILMMSHNNPKVNWMYRRYFAPSFTPHWYVRKIKIGGTQLLSENSTCIKYEKNAFCS